MSSTYSNFTYFWRETSGVTVDSRVDIIVKSVNDPPVGTPQNVTTNGKETLITLTSTDVDTNFATKAYYQIAEWPKMGQLYQVIILLLTLINNNY